MEEAKYSFNIKFVLHGYDCQLTMREDDPASGTQLIDTALQSLEYLQELGASPSHIAPVSKLQSQVEAILEKTPAVRPPAVSVPAAEPVPAVAPVPAPAPHHPVRPVCPQCGKSDQVELIHFVKDGKPKDAYKCQRCQKWQR